MRDFADTYIATKNKIYRFILFLLGIFFIGMSGIAIIASILLLFVGQSAEYPGMVEGFVFLGVFSFGIGVLFCLPFYAFDTEGDLKSFFLRLFRPSIESTTDPINEKIRASEEKKFHTKSKGKFMWEE